MVDDNHLARAWVLLRQRLQAPESTLKAYAADLNDYLAWRAKEKASPYDVDLETISYYVKGMSERINRPGQRRRFGRQQGLEPTTIYRRITTLRLWFDYLVDSEILLRNPIFRSTKNLARSPLPKPKSTPWIPSEREWDRIVAAVADETPRNRLMFLINYECALRREELCTLWLNDIDHALRQIAIRAEKSKSRSDRWLPISRETDALLIAYERTLSLGLSANQSIFRSESNRNCGAEISVWTWNKVIEKIREDAKVPRFHPHTIRHLSLTDLARAGWDVLELKAFAGHRKIATTETYIHLSGRELGKAMDRTWNSLFDSRRRTLRSVAHT